MNELFQTAFFISLFCVGLRIISSPGLILYFLREPYDNASTNLKKIVANIHAIDKDISNHDIAAQEINKKWVGVDITADINIRNSFDVDMGKVALIKKHIDDQWVERGKMIMKMKPINLKVNFLKPIIGCGTCMASVWTLFLYPVALWYFGSLYVWQMWVFIVPIAFIVAAMNSLFIALFDLMVEKKKCNCG